MQNATENRTTNTPSRQPYHEAWAKILTLLANLRHAIEAAQGLDEDAYGLDMRRSPYGRMVPDDTWGDFLHDLHAIDWQAELAVSVLESTAPWQVGLLVDGEDYPESHEARFGDVHADEPVTVGW